MRTIIYLIRKEFTQIFRNKFLSKAIFGIPIVQLLILVPAVTFEMKDIRMSIIDNDMSIESRELVSKLQGSEFFKIISTTFDKDEAEDLLNSNSCDLVLEIPSNFGNNVLRGENSRVMVLVNAINATSAQLSWAYISGVIKGYNSELVLKNIHYRSVKPPPQININNRFWYNTSLNYRYYMLPGVLVILVTAIGLLLAGLNVVKEKEMGTIEQINVTPIRRYQFIVAKLVPFLIIGLIDLAFGLVLGKVFFNVPFEGSLLILFVYATLYLIAVLGMTLFFSSISSTQQQFLFVVFFILMIFILMSGIFTPSESMPLWAQKFNAINPAAYFMKVIRMVMLKGSSLKHIIPEIIGITGIGVVMISLSILAYRKTA